MRKRETQVIGVGLALVIGLVALAGCGGDHPASASSPTAQSATTTAASTSASSALPAPSIADGKLLETAVLDSTAECLKIANAQISGVSHANERIAQAQEARTSLSQQVTELIALYHRVNPEAIIPYGEGRHVTTKQDILSILKELHSKPPAPPSAEACASELAQQLERGTGISAEG